MTRLPFIENMNENIAGIESPVMKITENGEYVTQNLEHISVDVKGGVAPSGQLEIVENGVYDVTTKASVKVEVPSGPAPEPIAKGSVIKLGGEDYRVLSVNEDLTDCEVMHIGPTILSYYYPTSPTADQRYDDWDTSDGTKGGIKYAGSSVDEACESFYDALPADIKEAIIEQDLVQHMWQINDVAEGEEDLLIENPENGFIYRLKKIDITAKPVGKRHAYLPTLQTIKDYYGSSVVGHTLARTFCPGSWFSDALPVSYQPYYALYLMLASYIGIGKTSASSALNCVCPIFHIDLTKVSL